MKVTIAHFPFDDVPGNFQTSQNRQAQRFEHGGFIFPVILAGAATMLKKAGHDVFWLDGPAEEMDEERFIKELEFIQPDFLLVEAKTPTIKRTWQNIFKFSQYIPRCRLVLCGDHVTALPVESYQQLKSFKIEKFSIMTGGDYDFGINEIAANEKERAAHEIFHPETEHSLDNVPIIDRSLCKWKLYGYEKGSGNYKYLPGTHTMFGRDCWWRHEGGCTFCSWTNTFKNWRVCSVDNAMEEVESCASLGIREIFDDTGTFPIGKWLHEFCDKLRKFNRGLRHGKARITMGCNMRPGALRVEDWRLMGASGFRFILFGLESANQTTLERINKGQADGDIEESCRLATKNGMHPHVTCMLGYPWETKEDAQKTIDLCRTLFKRGWIQTLQATIVIPYPGTELYRQCLENDWLKYTPGDWDQWDMRKPIMKTSVSDNEILSMTRGIYKSCITPAFILKKIFSARNNDDLKFLIKGARYMFGHLKDFSKPVSIH